MNFLDKQPTFGCGPIAIVNTLSWLGIPSSYNKLRNLFINLGYIPSLGVCDDWVDDVLEHFNIQYHSQIINEINIIEQALDSGCSVLLAYTWSMPNIRPTRDNGAHLIFISGHSGNFLTAHNVNGNGAEYKPKLNAFLKQHGGVVWIIRKPFIHIVKEMSLLFCYKASHLWYY